VTKNQAVMVLRMLKRSQKQVSTLDDLVESVGDSIDQEDTDYTDIRQSVKICAEKAQQAVTVMERYMREKTRN